jgi:hypothetical protein
MHKFCECLGGWGGGGGANQCADGGRMFEEVEKIVKNIFEDKRDHPKKFNAGLWKNFRKSTKNNCES